RFHNYSFFNQILIHSQCPNATRVAGFHTWRSLGRTVRKGEKGLAIFAPCVYKRKEDGGGLEGDADAFVKVLTGFRVVYAFDISQTEGEPLEALDAVRPELLCGGSPDGLWDALVAQANAAGFEVVRKRRLNENGYCDFGSQEIGVRSDVGDLQALKTLVHELSHALLHGDGLARDRSRQEIEVESVAFIVLSALDLDSGSYSFPYVARWAGGDVKVIAETGTRVVGCAKSILQHLELSELAGRA
ncbi:MAG: ArdC family protein, partial [Acidimicrobiia bacterium]